MPRSASPKQPKPEAAPNLDQWRETERRKSKMRSWLWLGTALFAVVVASLWGWTWINRLSLIDWKQGSESSLIQTSQKDWNTLFAKTKETELQKEVNSAKLKLLLSEIKNQMMTATTTPTSTTSSTTLATTTINTTTVTSTP